MPSELYIIGTVHVDVKGPDRLRKLLYHLRPQHVVLEADQRSAAMAHQARELLSSEEGFREMIAGCIKLYKGANPAAVARVLKVSTFEYFACKDFCEAVNIPLYLADEIDWEWLDAQMRNPRSEIYRDLVRHLRMTPSGLSRSVTQYYRGNLGRISAELLASYVPQEKAIATKAASLDGIVVTVTGLRHSHGAHYNLYERLRDLHPVRMTLLDADKL